MTRVTNFGLKRTYVEAGFNYDTQVTDPNKNVPEPMEGHSMANECGTAGEPAGVQPPRKKRKRTKKSKRDGRGMVGRDFAGESDVVGKGVIDNADPEDVVGEDNKTVAKRIGELREKKKAREKRSKGMSARPTESEFRRQKRIAERHAATTCFACREKGHAAKDCPATRGGLSGGKVLGICYRCGSTKHTLARCKKPVDSKDPLPFASCFVCASKGHLASACPQNKAKGIYPNGGCCKLCGDRSHLAKDCGLRKSDIVENSMMLGMGGEAGADEDDFHTIKRRKTGVEREERHEDKIKRLVDVKAGAHSGVIKSFGQLPTVLTKKVVYF